MLPATRPAHVVPGTPTAVTPALVSQSFPRKRESRPHTRPRPARVCGCTEAAAVINQQLPAPDHATGVLLLDQLDLPRTILPCRPLLTACDLGHVGVHFVAGQRLCAVLHREAFGHIGPVLPEALCEIAGDIDLERTIGSVRRDTGGRLFRHGERSLMTVDSRLRGNDS